MTQVIRLEEGELTDMKDVTGFFSWNVQEDKVFGDPVFADLFGVSHEALQAGAPIVDVLRYIDDGDRQRVAKALHETIITGNPCHQTYRIVHPGGRQVTVTGQGRCLRDGAGLPSIYTGTVSAQARVAPVAGDGDSLENHCIEALEIATQRRHSLAARYLSSALNVLAHNR